MAAWRLTQRPSLATIIASHSPAPRQPGRAPPGAGTRTACPDRGGAARSHGQDNQRNGWRAACTRVHSHGNRANIVPARDQVIRQTTEAAGNPDRACSSSATERSAMRVPGTAQSHPRHETERRGVRAFSLGCLVAQRDAGRGVGAPGSRILLRPSGVWSRCQLRRSVPRAWPRAGFRTVRWPRLVSVPGQESRSRTSAASRSSWPGFRRSPSAPRSAIGSAVRMTAPVRHAAVDEDAGACQSRMPLSAALDLGWATI